MGLQVESSEIVRCGNGETNFRATISVKGVSPRDLKILAIKGKVTISAGKLENSTEVVIPNEVNPRRLSSTMRDHNTLLIEGPITPQGQSHQKSSSYGMLTYVDSCGPKVVTEGNGRYWALSLDVSGFDVEDVSVVVKFGRVVVTAQHCDCGEHNTTRYNYSREMTIPTDVDAHSLKYNIRDGTLHIKADIH